MQNNTLILRSGQLWAPAFAGLLAAGVNAHAQSADALIDKLVDKGILTVEEATGLRNDADKDFNRAFAVKTGMPDWVSGYKFSGDIRGRYESFLSDNPLSIDRHRFRYRLRAGIAISMKDDLEVGFRLGSGDLDSASTITSGVDPISNNQSFQNNGSKKGVFIDLVYAKWSPIQTPNWAGTFTIGKMENPFVFSDMVFDGDYTPEGLAAQFGYIFNDRHALRLNSGAFVMDEISASGHDPYMLGSQLRYDAAWSPRLSSSLGAAIMSIQHVERLTSAAVPNINVGNSRSTSVSGTTVVLGAPVSDFNPVILDAALTYTLDSAPLYTGPFPIRAFAEYMNNTAASDQNIGWNAGIAFGKAGKRKTWELTYRYKHLEGDAWYEELVDSDSGVFYNTAVTLPPPATLRAPGVGYGSGTNIRGHVVKAGYTPFDALTINFAWFGLEAIEAPGDTWINRFQADVVVKF